MDAVSAVARSQRKSDRSQVQNGIITRSCATTEASRWLSTEKWSRRARTRVHAKGYICLESEGGVVHYRNVRIKELPATPVEEKDISISNRGFRSICTGLDLAGWKASEAGKSAWQAKDWVLAFNGSVSGEQAKLQTESKFNLSGFIMDFRFTDKSNKLELLLPNASEPILFLAQGESPFSESLEKVGSWNRVELVITNERNTIIVNGKSHAIQYFTSEGPVTLIPDGAVEVANLYVRETDQ